MSDAPATLIERLRKGRLAYRTASGAVYAGPTAIETEAADSIAQLERDLAEARETNRRLNRRANLSEGMFTSYRMSFSGWAKVLFNTIWDHPNRADRSHADFLAWCKRIDVEFANGRATAAESERDRLAAELAQERMDRDEKIAQASAKADYEAERAGDIENENDRLAAALRPLERHVALNCYDRQIEGGWEKSETLMQLLDAARASLQTGEKGE